MKNKRTVKPGERINVIGNYSEVMMHMRLAGKPVQIEQLADENGRPRMMAQVYSEGRPFGGPVTTGEAGIYHDGTEYYTYEADPDDLGDANPEKIAIDMTNSIRAAMGSNVKVITNLGL